MQQGFLEDSSPMNAGNFGFVPRKITSSIFVKQFEDVEQKICLDTFPCTISSDENIPNLTVTLPSCEGTLRIVQQDEKFILCTLGPSVVTINEEFHILPNDWIQLRPRDVIKSGDCFIRIEFGSADIFNQPSEQNNDAAQNRISKTPQSIYQAQAVAFPDVPKNISSEFLENGEEIEENLSADENIHIPMPEVDTKILRDLETLFNSQYKADLAFGSKKRFSKRHRQTAHSAVMRTRCPKLFEVAKCKTNSKGITNVHLHDPYLCLPIISRYCYTSDISWDQVDMTRAVALATISQTLHVPHLQYECEKYILDFFLNFKNDSAFHLYVCATTLQNTRIEEFCMNLFLNNWPLFCGNQSGISILGVTRFRDITSKFMIKPGPRDIKLIPSVDSLMSDAKLMPNMEMPPTIL